MSLATILDDLQQSTDFGKLKSSLEALAFAANITTMAAASPSPSPSPHHHHASSGHWDAFQAALRSHEISSSSSSSSEPRKRTGTIKESKPTQEQEQFFKDISVSVLQSLILLLEQPTTPNSNEAIHIKPLTWNCMESLAKQPQVKSKQLFTDKSVFNPLIGFFLSNDEQNKQKALSVICELCIEDIFRPMCIDAGIIQPLISMLFSVEQNVIKEKTAKTLVLIAANEQCSEKILKFSIKNCIILLDSPDIQLKTLIVGFFYNLSVSKNNREQLCQLAIFPQLAKSGLNSNVSLKTNACLALANLSSVEKSRKNIVENDAFPSLCAFMADPMVFEVDYKVKVAEAVAMLVSEDDHKMKLVNSPSIESLKKLADPSTDQKLLKEFLEIIDTLVTFEQASSKVISSGIIDALFSLLSTFQGEVHQQIVSTIQACANNEKNTKLLVEKGFLDRVGDMLKNRNARATASELLATLVVYDSAQNRVMEMRLLPYVINLLNSEEVQDKIGALQSLFSLTKTANGCETLRRQGMAAKVTAIIGNEYEDRRVIAWARKINDGLTNQNTTAGTRLSTFGFAIQGDTEMVKVDFEFVKPCQEIVHRATKKKQIKVTVNWKNINKLDEDKKRMAFLCLNNPLMWKHLSSSVEKFCFADKKNLSAFITQIKYIVIDVTDTSKLDVEVLMLKYSVGFDGTFFTPEDFERKLNEKILGIDEALSEKGDDGFASDLRELKAICRDNDTIVTGDINKLYFFLQTTKAFSNLSPLDEEAVPHLIKEILGEDEILLKAWRLVKFNKNALLQERLLFLSNSHYYTVDFDPVTKKMNWAHCKGHALAQFFLCDIGYLTDGKKKVRDIEADKRVWALNVIMTEEAHDHITKRKVLPDDEVVPTGEELKSPRGASGNLNMSSSSNSNNNKLSLMMDDDSVLVSPREREQQQLQQQQQQQQMIQKRERPNTDENYVSVFIAPRDMKKSKHRAFLEEIAWCISTAAMIVQKSREACHEPFYEHVTKPTGKMGPIASIYNSLKLGYKKSPANSPKSSPRVEGKSSSKNSSSSKTEAGKDSAAANNNNNNTATDDTSVDEVGSLEGELAAAAASSPVSNNNNNNNFSQEEN